MLIQWARLSFLCLPPARENPHHQVPADVPSAGHGIINQEAFLHPALTFEQLCSSGVSTQDQPPF